MPKPNLVYVAAHSLYYKGGWTSVKAFRLEQYEEVCHLNNPAAELWSEKDSSDPFSRIVPEVFSNRDDAETALRQSWEHIKPV